MLNNLLLISLTVSAAILIFLLLRLGLRRRVSAKWLAVVWLILAVRLIIPFRWEWEKAPVQLPPAVSEQVNAVLSYRPAPAVQQEKDVSVSAGAVVAAVWAGGASVLFFYHVGAYVLFRRRIKPYLIQESPATYHGIFVLDPPVFRCAVVQRPVTLGWLRPMILLPLTDYTEQERAAVLLHERCHFRRGDLWTKFLLLLAKSLHWFNPLVWLMVKTAEEDLEFACDEQVIARQGRSFKKIYSEVILKTAEKQERSNEE